MECYPVLRAVREWRSFSKVGGGKMIHQKNKTNEEMYRDNDLAFKYMKDFFTQDKVLPTMRKNARRYKNSIIYLNYSAALLQQYFRDNPFQSVNRLIDKFGVIKAIYYLKKAEKDLDSRYLYEWNALMADAYAACSLYRRAIKWYTYALNFKDSYEVKYNRAICLCKINSDQAPDMLLELLEEIELERSISDWQIELREKLETTWNVPALLITYVELFFRGRGLEAKRLIQTALKINCINNVGLSVIEYPYIYIFFILEKNKIGLIKSLQHVMNFTMDENMIHLWEMIRRATWLNPQDKNRWMDEIGHNCKKDLGKWRFYYGVIRSRFLRKQLYFPDAYPRLDSHREDRYIDFDL